MTDTDPDAPFGRTANGHPIPGGFTGTIPAFLDWLEERLTYGGVNVSDPMPTEFHLPSSPNCLVREVRLVTGGYSDDEALLGRVGRSMFATRFWESDHRGGMSVYHMSVAEFNSEKETTWLEPPSDVFEEVWRARTLVVDTGHSSRITFDLPGGARLRFSEPDRDFCCPAGVLTLEQIPISESADLFPAPSEHPDPLSADGLNNILGEPDD